MPLPLYVIEGRGGDNSKQASQPEKQSKSLDENVYLSWWIRHIHIFEQMGDLLLGLKIVQQKGWQHAGTLGCRHEQQEWGTVSHRSSQQNCDIASWMSSGSSKYPFVQSVSGVLKCFVLTVFCTA